MDELKVLHSKKCIKCGTVINGNHHIPPFLQRKLPKGFYGNNVKKTILSKCTCGEMYISLLKPKGNSYQIIDLIAYKPPEAKPAKDVVIKAEAEEVSNDYMKLKLKMLDREELEKLAKDSGIKGNIKIMKDDTLITKLLNL